MADTPATADVLYNNPEAARRTLQRENEKVETDLSVIGMTDAQRRAKVARFEVLHKTTGLPYQLVTELLARDNEADLAEHRGVVFDEAAGQAGADEVRRRVVGIYGPRYGEELIARTEKFVASHPDLAEVLNRRGIATQPSGSVSDTTSVFAKLVEHIHQTDYR
jgi:hypothetical protein